MHEVTIITGGFNYYIQLPFLLPRGAQLTIEKPRFTDAFLLITGDPQVRVRVIPGKEENEVSVSYQARDIG